MSKILNIEIDLKNDFPIELEYEGKELSDEEKFMLILATKNLQDMIYENFKLDEYIEQLQEEAREEIEE